MTNADQPGARAPGDEPEAQLEPETLKDLELRARDGGDVRGGAIDATIEGEATKDNHPNSIGRNCA